MFLEKKSELIERTNTLKIFANELDINNINENIDSFLEEIQRDLTFNVLCLGDFSSGKSTFINQFFIGKNVLPTNVTTTTAKLTVLKYGLEEKIVLKYKDGTQKEFHENFENILKHTVAKGGEEVEKIDLVEVYINSEFLKDGIVIVDSPGLNDPETERMDVTLGFINRADSILYLIMATQAWKKSEKEFLEEKILSKEDLDKIFFLLNYWDLIDENQRDEVIKFVKTEMEKSLKIVSAELGQKIPTPPLIPISAKTKENFDVLKKKLWEYLSTKKGENILENKYKKLEVLKRRIKELIIEKIELQKKESKELEDSLKNLKQEVEKLKEDVTIFKKRLKPKIDGEVTSFVEEVQKLFERLKENIIERLSKRIDNNIEGIDDVADFEKIIKDSIRKSIYLEKRNFENLYRKFLKKIEKILEEEKSRLDLKNYFSKNKVLYLDDIKEHLKPEISIKVDYMIDAIITGGSVLGGAVLASVNPLFAIVALGGVAYNIFIKAKKEKQEILKQLSIIEEQIDDTFSEYITRLEGQQDEITETILENIRNELIEAYLEKERIYKQALEDKKINKDDELTAFYNDKIKELEKI
ncbi:hypothetical protein FHQ18_00575 [Deferribacter autotrophicus]|uniref:Dynamin-type G domain-containing protein n=1 Tax=Deferribacter autotrophicus TaxID=500465 RepID=A0A5A8F5K1_9BACT|nr:dynamin family protein [Deferribacter autotrophicus]KAA0259406.1 hypothetical protein FHQ18_00575 [Deferribacter autotrophicus]